MKSLQNLIAATMAAFLVLGAAASAQESEASAEAATSSSGGSASLGGLSIKPSRVELDAGSKGTTVTLANVSDVPISYRIDLIELGLSDTGNFRPMAEGEDATWSAALHTQYSPRQVTLAAGERQKVRVISRVPRDTPAGEYRSHMSFTSIPLVKDEPAPEEGGEDGKTALEIGVQYRVSIPLLLRVGDISGGTRIEGARIETDADGRQAVRLTIGLTGTRSDWVGARILDDRGEEVGRVAGVSVMVPARTRTFLIPIADTARPTKIELLEQKTERDFGALIETYDIP